MLLLSLGRNCLLSPNYLFFLLPHLIRGLWAARGHAAHGSRHPQDAERRREAQMREFAHLPLSCIAPMVWMLCLRSDIILSNLGGVSMYKGTWRISCSRPHVWIIVMSCSCSWSVSGLAVSLFTFFYPPPFQGHLPCMFHRNPWVHIIHGNKNVFLDMYTHIYAFV